jgi:hypothetical protein
VNQSEVRTRTRYGGTECPDKKDGEDTADSHACNIRRGARDCSSKASPNDSQNGSPGLEDFLSTTQPDKKKLCVEKASSSLKCEVLCCAPHSPLMWRSLLGSGKDAAFGIDECHLSSKPP